MKPECAAYLNKARALLETARNLLKDGYANEAGRAAYLAAFNAAQSYIYDHTGRASKTHSGVRSQFAQLCIVEPRLGPEMTVFLSDAYNIKKIADYELGADAHIPMDRAAKAVTQATDSVDRIARQLEDGAAAASSPR